MEGDRFFGQASDGLSIEGDHYCDLRSGGQSIGCCLSEGSGHYQGNDGQTAGTRSEEYLEESDRIDRRSVGRSERRSGDHLSSVHGCHDANHVGRHDGRIHDCYGTDRGHQKVADMVGPHLQGEGVQPQGSDREEVTALEAAGTKR